jgi:hypothetical protein
VDKPSRWWQKVVFAAGNQSKNRGLESFTEGIERWGLDSRFEQVAQTRFLIYPHDRLPAPMPTFYFDSQPREQSGKKSEKTDCLGRLCIYEAEG